MQVCCLTKTSGKNLRFKVEGCMTYLLIYFSLILHLKYHTDIRFKHQARLQIIALVANKK
jgi:hypothetical protein